MSKKEILDWFTVNSESLSVEKILFVLCISFAVGIVIFITYRLAYTGVSYNGRFNTGNVVIVLITSVIMLMISSNMAISLGMVGALSIVRFRTAIKDPSDTIYIFWAIVEGLCVGAQIYKLAVISTIFIAIVLLASSYYANVRKKYLIIIRGGKDTDLELIKATLKPYYPKMGVRASNYVGERCEIICEVSARQEMNVEAITALRNCKHVSGVNWLLEMGERIG
ncbi:MAG: DUF4956 domain-containing protein [Lachnospiraceae bacterium]|nr:DUF4956 domain-containing protein [Lachnospiraceae bacterium]